MSGAAVVTGAARGLGFEIARRLAERGFAVNVGDVDEAGAQAAAQKLGGSAWGSGLDVTDLEACRAAAQQAVETHGSLAVWVNNAGILRTGPSWSHSPVERRALVDVNVHGLMNGTIAALELMRPANAGQVLNVVSLAGLAAPPGETVYAATKPAALAFTVGTLYDLRQDRCRSARHSGERPTQAEALGAQAGRRRARRLLALYAEGLMFAFRWKRFCGSYLSFRA